MVDYKIDSTFQAVRTDWGSFKSVSGVDEFEQEVIVTLHSKLQEVIGETDSKEIIPRIELIVTRLAREYDVIAEVKQIDISVSDDARGRYDVEIIYETTAPFSEVF